MFRELMTNARKNTASWLAARGSDRESIGKDSWRKGKEKGNRDDETTTRNFREGSGFWGLVDTLYRLRGRVSSRKSREQELRNKGVSQAKNRGYGRHEATPRFDVAKRSSANSPTLLSITFRRSIPVQRTTLLV
jgi:hypothetical protein